VELFQRKRPNLRKCILASAIGALVFGVWINASSSWMVIGAADGFNPSTEQGLSWPLIIVRMLGAVLVVPVIEELFWRSFLLRWIVSHDFLRVEPAKVGLGAFIITSVLFGIEHNFWFAGVIAGAAYNFVYMKDSDLKSSVIAHAVTNLLLGLWVLRTHSWSYW
jgi:CAAX prenyl protease-like protein